MSGDWYHTTSEIASKDSEWEFTGEKRTPKAGEHFAVIPQSDQTIVFKTTANSPTPTIDEKYFILRNKNETHWIFQK